MNHWPRKPTADDTIYVSYYVFLWFIWHSLVPVQSVCWLPMICGSICNTRSFICFLLWVWIINLCMADIFSNVLWNRATRLKLTLFQTAPILHLRVKLKSYLQNKIKDDYLAPKYPTNHMSHGAEGQTVKMQLLRWSPPPYWIWR